MVKRKLQEESIKAGLALIAPVSLRGDPYLPEKKHPKISPCLPRLPSAGKGRPNGGRASPPLFDKGG